MIMVDKTFRELTAPGYFNFSSTQKPQTLKVSNWFNSVYSLTTEQVNLFDDIFRLWQTRDYSGVTVSRTPWIKYLLNQYGIDWFSGNEQQAAALVGIVSAGYSDLVIENFQYLLAKLSEPPFDWITDSGGSSQVVFGSQVPAQLSEILVIYSNSVSLPATPSNTPYVERDWEPPTDWTLYPSSSTYLSRGYLVGSNIVWTTAISTSAAQRFFMAADLLDFPLSPIAGDVTLVNDDGTGDTVSTYFYDGSQWRKNSTLYSNQGLVSDGVPSDPQQRVVAAPDESTSPFPISSETPPPLDGLSLGYGMYSGLANQIISANIIYVYIELTTEGLANLGVIINLFRRIKPTQNSLFLFYTVEGSMDPPVQQQIYDKGALI
jgi:hypothetical protein